LYFCNSVRGAVKIPETDNEADLSEQFDRFRLEGACRLADVPLASCRDPSFDSERYLIISAHVPVDGAALEASIDGLRFGKKVFTMSFDQPYCNLANMRFVDKLRYNWPGVVDALLKSGRSLPEWRGSPRF
jgi:hypothetical protein